MSELDLPTLAKSGEEKIESKCLSPMEEVNAALKECGFGIFHIRLLITSLVGFVAGVLVSNTTSYLLPSAECDLQMNLVHKGLLNAMPYFGMLCSSLIAGFLTDTFGRKVFIYFGTGGIFVFTLIAGSSQTYTVLVTAKFFEGLLFATSFSAGLTLTAEFCHKGIRDRVVICQSSFAAFSQIVIAAMSWGILINDWHYSFFDGKFVLNTWNFYIYAMSSWSLVSVVLYIFIPESPKYLITQKKFDEARALLIKIYKENTRNSEDKFLYKDLWKDKVKETSIPEDVESNKMSVAHQLVIGLRNLKPMFRRPLILYLMLICTINFFVMLLYNVLRLWYPQVSAIIEHTNFVSADNVHQDLCGVLDGYTSHLSSRNVVKNATAECIPIKSGDETYINSIIIGCVCIIPYFVSGMLITKIGKKPLLIVSTLLAFGSTLGLRFTATKTFVVILFSVSIAITQMLMSLNQAYIFEFFPTTTRTLAVSMVLMSGRIGTLVGNISFPVLLKMGCVIPFYTLAGTMLFISALALFLPLKKK